MLIFVNILFRCIYAGIDYIDESIVCSGSVDVTHCARIAVVPDEAGDTPVFGILYDSGIPLYAVSRVVLVVGGEFTDDNRDAFLFGTDRAEGFTDIIDGIVHSVFYIGAVFLFWALSR